MIKWKMLDDPTYTRAKAQCLTQFEDPENPPQRVKLTLDFLDGGHPPITMEFDSVIFEQRREVYRESSTFGDYVLVPDPVTITLLVGAQRKRG